MCTADCVLFGFRVLGGSEVKGKRVLEVGSRIVNGSLRPIIEALHPDEYVGVDLESGPGVDRICAVEDLTNVFGEKSFDLVVSTELLEHVRDWRKAIVNLKRVCRTGGLILITVPSIGFEYHAYPRDFWRYEPEDLRAIFAEMEILELERDSNRRGVHLKVKKPSNSGDVDLSRIRLYSIIERQRIQDVDERRLKRFLLLLSVRRRLARLLPDA